MSFGFLRKDGPLLPKTPAEFSDLRRMIRELTGRVHVLRMADRERIAEVRDEDLIGGLAALQVELKSVGDSVHIRDDAAFDALSKRVFGHIDSVLATTGPHVGSEAFENDLYALHRCLQAQERSSRRRLRWIRGAALLVSAGPVLGLAIYWAITNHYSIALLESVDILYPDQRFVPDPVGYYRADYDAMADTIADFEDYYFRETRKQPEPPTNRAPHNIDGFMPVNLAQYSPDVAPPLPTVYDERVATDWGMPPGTGNGNLLIYRVFLRNLKEANLVRKVGVSARRSGDSSFFWDRLDVSTQLELYPQQNHFTVRTARAPVKDVVLTIEPVMIFGDVVTPAVDTDSDIVATEDFYPKFGAHPLFAQHEFPLFYRFPREAVPVDAARRAGESLFQDDSGSRQELSHNDFDVAVSSRPIARIDCRDDTTILVASDMPALEMMTRVARVDTLAVRIAYKLLDDRQKTSLETLQFDSPFAFVDPVHRTDRYSVWDCIGAGPVPPGGVGGGDLRDATSRVIKEITVLAGTLNQGLSLTDGEIVIEATFHLDMLDMGETTSITKFHHEPVVMSIGDFVAVNIVLTNYPSGVYDFEFFLNDDAVSSVRLDPLWPQSLHYRPADAALFRRR